TDAFANYLNTPGSFANPNIDRGNSDFDIRHAFSAGVTYELPSPPPALRVVLGGWPAEAVPFARWPPPSHARGPNFRGAGIAAYQRPNLVPGAPLEFSGSGYPGGKAFNRAAFVAPPAAQQGGLGRNVLRGFGAAQTDLGVQRQFRLAERARIRFR